MKKLLLCGSLALVAATARADDLAACPDLGEVISQINTLMEEAELEEASELAASGEAALFCQPPPVDAATMTSLFHLGGAVQVFLGNQEEAARYFEWALSVAPSASLDPELGARAQIVFSEVKSDLGRFDTGHLEVQGETQVWLDGHSIPSGRVLDFAAGPHLLQWLQHGEGSHQAQARAIEVLPGEHRILALEELQVQDADHTLQSFLAHSEQPLLDRRKKLLVSSGGTLVATSAALLVLAAQSYQDFFALDDPDLLESTRKKTNTLAVFGVSTGVAGAALVGAAFVPTGQAGLGLTLSW